MKKTPLGHGLSLQAGPQSLSSLHTHLKEKRPSKDPTWGARKERKERTGKEKITYVVIIPHISGVGQRLVQIYAEGWSKLLGGRPF